MTGSLLGAGTGLPPSAKGGDLRSRFLFNFPLSKGDEGGYSMPVWVAPRYRPSAFTKPSIFPSRYSNQLLHEFWRDLFNPPGSSVPSRSRIFETQRVLAER